jgi:hypothetical protein
MLAVGARLVELFQRSHTMNYFPQVSEVEINPLHVLRDGQVRLMCG